MLKSTCLALLIFTGIASADVQTGVVRSGGQAIPGATITAECGTDKITTVTDDAGRFEMGGLPSTPCKYTVLIFGFEPLSERSFGVFNPSCTRYHYAKPGEHTGGAGRRARDNLCRDPCCRTRCGSNNCLRNPACCSGGRARSYAQFDRQRWSRRWTWRPGWPERTRRRTWRSGWSGRRIPEPQPHPECRYYRI